MLTDEDIKNMPNMRRWERHAVIFQPVIDYCTEKQSIGLLYIRRTFFEGKRNQSNDHWYEGYCGIETSPKYYSEILCPELACIACKMKLYPQVTCVTDFLLTVHYPNYYGIVMRSRNLTGPATGRRAICESDIPDVIRHLRAVDDTAWGAL